MQVGNKVYYSYRINYRHSIDIGQWGPEVGDQIKCFIFACFLFKTGHLTLIKCPPDSHRSSRLVSFLYTLL